MASITIRNLDEDVKTKLRVQAAQNNRSMEEEARIILRRALDQAVPKPNIADLANSWMKSYNLPYKLEQESLNDEIDKALNDYYSKNGGT